MYHEPCAICIRCPYCSWAEAGQSCPARVAKYVVAKSSSLLRALFAIIATGSQWQWPAWQYLIHFLLLVPLVQTTTLQRRSKNSSAPHGPLSTVTHLFRRLKYRFVIDTVYFLKVKAAGVTFSVRLPSWVRDKICAPAPAFSKVNERESSCRLARQLFRPGSFYIQVNSND